MERTRLIEHLLEHYVSRDQFRYFASEKLMNRGLPYSTSFLDINGGDPSRPHSRAIETNRKSLKKVKDVTLEHLHDLLHQDFMFPTFEHIHSGEDLFSYVIEEESDASHLRIA